MLTTEFEKTKGQGLRLNNYQKDQPQHQNQYFDVQSLLRLTSLSMISSSVLSNR